MDYVSKYFAKKYLSMSQKYFLSISRKLKIRQNILSSFGIGNIQKNIFYIFSRNMKV